MKITIQSANLMKVARELQDFSEQQARVAASTALNDVAFQVMKNVQSEMDQVFDRVTPYIKKSIQVDKARPDHLVATIEPRYMGGKGVDPASVLRAELVGGSRRDKRSEKALRRVGILPTGYVTVIPRQPFPGSDDGRGNIRGAFMVQLLSYLQAFGEQGYRANMGAKRKARIADRTTFSSLATRKQVPMIRGFELFVSTGKLRGEDLAGRKNRTRHLQPGIWARSGAYGAKLQPVLLFVRAPTYFIRLNLAAVLERSNVEDLFARRFRGRIRDAHKGLIQ